jgi:hypothetical protein
MAVQAEPSWEVLPRQTRDVVEWAAACERTSQDVGTRALLIGLLRAGGDSSRADDLLRHFGISNEQLYHALRGNGHSIDPHVTTRVSLKELPRLTGNARRCLIRANGIREGLGRKSVDTECLFGALLQSNGTARIGLDQLLAEVSMDEVAAHYLNWLERGSGSYAEALAEQFPKVKSAGSGSGPDTWPHLATLLRHQTREGSPYRAVGLGIVVFDNLLLTAVQPSLAGQVRLTSGSTHELEWLGTDGGLSAAILNLSVGSARPFAILDPGPGDLLRCYAVSDDGATVQLLAGYRLSDRQPPGNSFHLQLMEALPEGHTPIGSPVLGNDGLVGIVESYSAEGLTVIGRSAIEEFLATLEIPAAADPPAAVAIGNASGAGNDTVADIDQLGFDVYVEAFADLIMSEHTKPPLTIGIFGSWGMGKSFLLDHIRRTVEERQRTAPNDGPTIHSVCFNAWEYSATDAIWPALVRKIVKRLDELDSWPRRKRVCARIRWNLRREWRPLWIKLVTAGLVFATLAAVALGKHQAFAALFATTIALGLGGVVKAANDPVAKWVTGLFADSDYGGQLRQMEDIKHDLDVLERRLHVAGDPEETRLTGRILVIIDDLDRCEPAKAVEVLQAVNLLLNFPSFIICLGIDARIITAAVEKHYEGLLGVAGASGYEYLDKIVQIPFRIPEPNPGEITAFIQSQLAVPPDPAAVSGSTDEAAEAELSDTRPQVGTWTAAAQLDAESERLWPIAEAPTPAPSLSSPQVLFTLDEQRAFELFVPYLRPNPRHLKRLINVYRLVRSLGLAEGERLVLDRPAAVLRWLIMWAQWPLTSSMLLRRLEGPGTDADQDADPLLALLDQVEKSIDRKARAERDDDPRKLRGLLEVPGCVLSIDEIRRIRRYTVNFNPAIEEQLRGSDGSPSEVPEPA